MIEKIRWWLAGGLMGIAGLIQIVALKVMPTDTEMMERILKQTRTGEAPDLDEVFDNDF